MVELILKHLVYTTIFIAVSIFIGAGISKLWRFSIEQNYRGVFKVFLIGFFSIVTLFAIAVSKGMTVLWGFIILGSFIWLANRKSQQHTPSELQNDSLSFTFLLQRLLELSIVSLAIILYRTSFMDGGGYLIERVYDDYVFYAKLSKYFLETGIENAEFDYLFLEKSVIPYHYVDVWINSALIYVTSENAVELIILSSYTIGIAGVWLGLMALLETWFSTTIWSKLIALFLLFTTGLFWGAIIKIPFLESTDIFARHSINYSKLFPIYWIILIVIVLYREHKTYRNTYIVTALLALPIINISSAPGVFSLLFLFFLSELFRDESLKWEIIIRMVIVATFIAIFYKTGQPESGGSWSFDYREYFSATYIRTFINVIAGASIQIFLLYIPVTLVLMLSAKRYGIKSVRDILFTIAIVFFAFVIQWAFFHKNGNAVQLFSNTFIPFITCFFIAVGCDLVKTAHSKMYRNCILATMLLLPFFGLVKDINERTNLASSTSTTRKSIEGCVDFFSTKVKNPTGVYFSSDTVWTRKYMPFGALDMKLQQFVNRERFHTISLSIFDIPLDHSSINYKNEVVQVKNSLFNRYIDKQPRNSIGDLNYLQQKFIADYDVEYVLTSRSYALPNRSKQYLELLYDEPAIDLKVYSVMRDRLMVKPD